MKCHFLNNFLYSVNYLQRKKPIKKRTWLSDFKGEYFIIVINYFYVPLDSVFQKFRLKCEMLACINVKCDRDFLKIFTLICLCIFPL